MSEAIIPVPGREYQVEGSVVFEHYDSASRRYIALNGVFFTFDGIAYAGRVRRDEVGEYVETAWDDDGMVEAHPDWAAMIVREIPPVNVYRTQAA